MPSGGMARVSDYLAADRLAHRAGAADEFDGPRPRAAHLPAQIVGCGGFRVSSMAQNGIDHTKSAEVPVRVSPGMPSKIGGWSRGCSV